MTFVQVCNKGDMLLEVDKSSGEFKLTYNMTDLRRLNIHEFLSFKIYDLIKRLNPDLIDDIQIIRKHSDDEIDVFFKFKNIAKELGMRPRCMLLKTIRTTDDSDPSNIKVVFKARSLTAEKIEERAFPEKNSLNQYSVLTCEFADTYIEIKGSDIKMRYNFLIRMQEELPQYMENMIGLMMKKIFHNVKRFVDRLEQE